MPDRPVLGPPPAWWLSASAYAAIGIVGVGLFAFALYRASLPNVPAAEYVRLALAVAGGALAMIGLGRWNVLRRYPGGGRNRPEPKKPEAPPIYQSYRPPPRDDERPPGRVAPPFEPFRYGAVARRRAPAALAVGVIALVLVGFGVAGLPLPAAAVSSAPSAPARAPAEAPASPLVPVAGPRPAGAISCTPFYPVYSSVNGLFPPLPKYSKQSPCKVTHDEIHASFSSALPGSGDAVRFPIVLPGSGVDVPAGTYADVDFGMVVKGDPSSVYGQSYASAIFQPTTESNGTTAWSLWVAIWSLELNTSCTSGLNFTWLGSYGCVLNDVGSGNGDEIASGIAGNTSANVTLVGSPSDSSRPFQIYFNDSTDPTASVAWTATAKATGTYLFQPYYAAACPDACLLNWSMPFGLGEGVDLCDWTGCFSYNATTQLGTPPVELGAPQFWNGLAYSADYLYVALESSTGACGALGGVPPCDPYAQAGIYPTVTFNGSALEVAGNYSFATEDFGGATHEFNGYGTSTDYLPLFLDEFTNSSRVGYLAPGTPLNVSVRAQALGTVRWVNLSYQVPGGTLTNVTMALVSGTNGSGTYAGAVPAVGGNGTVSFRVIATDAAGGTVELPAAGDPPATVNRTAIPTATIALAIVPGSCGRIVLNGGAPLGNGSSTKLLAGAYSLVATGCYPYAFTGWTTSGGLTVVGSGPSAVLDARANGTVTATFAYYRPLDTVTLDFTPSTCGEIGLNGTVYPATGSPQPVEIRDGGTYNLSVASCGGESFSGWAVSSSANLSILGPLLSLHGNGTLTATFVPTSTSYPVLFETSPSTCGGVRYDRVGYTDGESVNLLAGSGYPIGPDPCAGFGYATGNVTTSGLVSVNGGNLSVAGAGTVVYAYYKLTLVDIVTSPSTCGGVDWDGVLAPGGAELNVTNHTAHSLTGAPCPGYYLEALSVSGALTLVGTEVTVNGPGSVLATFRPGTEEFFVGFITSPAGCGSIVFDGTSYANSGYADVLPGTIHTLRASPCPGYGFVAWVPSGGVAIANDLAYVNQSGSIEAIFHPLVGVQFETLPTSCGSIVVDGVPYANGTSAMLPENTFYSIAADPCAHYVLSAWISNGGATIANGSLELNATAIVEALFVPALYLVTVGIEPASCGEVTIGPIAYGNGSSLSLAAGVYPIAWSLCVGFALVGWSTSGGLSVAGTSLTVTGPGNLTEIAAPVPPVLTLDAPSTTASGLATYFSAAVATLIPPYNYTFSWSFGDGTNATTPSNFTSHTYASPGVYRVAVTVHDPYGRTATAYANVTAVASSSSASFSIGTTGILVLGLAAAALVAGVLVALWRARAAPRAEPEPSAGPSGEVRP